MEKAQPILNIQIHIKNYCSILLALQLVSNGFAALRAARETVKPFDHITISLHAVHLFHKSNTNKFIWSAIFLPIYRIILMKYS
jgi:hypothetical protein